MAFKKKKNLKCSDLPLVIELLKFGFSEKATKFKKIFVVFLIRASFSVRATAYLSKIWRNFLITNVDKSYYPNLTYEIIFT